MLRRLLLTGLCVLAPLGAALAETRVTLKSAKAGTSYYIMMVQLAEMMKQAPDVALLPTVEESQGSVQNVKEAAVRPGNFLFTTPPNLLEAARKGAAPFEGASFDGARALFPMPFVTIHFVVRADAGIETTGALAGKTFIAGGKGTFCEGRTRKILEALELLDKVEIVDVELDAAGSAMRNRKVDGYATCSSHPTPQLVELATTLPVRILGFSPAERERIVALDPLSGPITIAAGTYAGQDRPVETVGVPVGAYMTTATDEATAYAITRTFWAWKERLAQAQPWWAGVDAALVAQLGAKIHPGAARYYAEHGITIPAAMR